MQVLIDNVPFVEGSWPFVGHGIAFGKDNINFIRRCYRKYGKVFKIKLFNQIMTIVCDQTLAEEFFDQKEENMSLYQVLERLFFADAFSSNPK